MVRRRFVAMFAAAVGITLTISLGFWQLRRADAKIALQAQWDAVMARAPQDIAAVDFDAVAQKTPIRVRVRGVWQPAATVWLNNRPFDRRAGFWLVTALRPTGAASAANTNVLIYRGWAQRDPVDRLRTPEVAQPLGEVAVEGVAVAALSNLMSLGDERLAGPLPAVWQNLDYAAFESASGLKVARFVIHQTDAYTEAEGLIRRAPQLATDVDRHYGYAVQWFSLAALIAGLTTLLIWRARVRRRAE